MVSTQQPGPLPFHADLGLLAQSGRAVFSELTERQLHRLAVTSVGELIEHITRYIDRRNINPKPLSGLPVSGRS